MSGNLNWYRESALRAIESELDGIPEEDDPDLQLLLNTFGIVLLAEEDYLESFLQYVTPWLDAYARGETAIAVPMAYEGDK